MILLTKTVTYLAAVAVACLGSVTDAVEVASWMSGVKDNTPLHQLVIPGSHDTCAYDATNKTVKGWVLAQSSTLSQQLQRGIRYLDMRVHTCQGTNGGKLCLYHGRYYLNKNFDSVLQDISSFFAARPSETIVMRLMVEAVSDGLDLFAGKRGQIDGFQELFEKTYINQNPAMWVQTNQFGGNGVAPMQLTLGGARGKIVLFWDNGSKTSRYGYDYSLVDTRRVWEFDTYDALMNEYTRRTTGVSANGGWFENPTSGIVWNSEWYSWLINWLRKVPYNIDKVANKIQPRVLQELRAGRAMQKGIVSMDYPRDDVIMELISSTLRRFAK